MSSGDVWRQVALRLSKTHLILTFSRSTGRCGMRDFNSTRIAIETLHEGKRQLSVLTTACSDCLEC